MQVETFVYYIIKEFMTSPSVCKLSGKNVLPDFQNRPDLMQAFLKIYVVHSAFDI